LEKNKKTLAHFPLLPEEGARGWLSITPNKNLLIIVDFLILDKI